MRDELEYKLYVAPPVMAVMAKMQEDAAREAGIQSEELHRAVFEWLTERFLEYKSTPEWLTTMTNRFQE